MLSTTRSPTFQGTWISAAMGQKLTQLRRARNATTFLNCDRATPKFGAARSAQPAGEPKTA
jgi:hypothetical protein